MDRRTRSGRGPRGPLSLARACGVEGTALAGEIDAYHARRKGLRLGLLILRRALIPREPPPSEDPRALH